MVTRNEDTAGLFGKIFQEVVNGHHQQWIKFEQAFTVSEMSIIAFFVSLTVFNMIVLIEVCKNPLHRLMWSED